MKSDRLKLCIIKFKKYLLVFKRLSISWFIFIISIGLSLSICVPSLFHKFPDYSFWANKIGLPYKLILTGKIISVDEQYYDYSIYTVHVGGYNIRPNQAGEFELDFLSHSKENIVIVVLDNNDKLVYSSIISIGIDEFSHYVIINLDTVKS